MRTGRWILAFLLTWQLWAAQPALLLMRVVEGDGGIHTIGTRLSQPLVLLITDESGQPVPGAWVSVRLPESGASGVFPNGLHSDVLVSGEDGRVTVRGITWGRGIGTMQVRITAVKGEARAGLISTQHLTEPAKEAARQSIAARNESPRVDRISRTKWIVMTMLIGGAAAGGLAVATGRQPASGPAAHTPSPTQPVIGAPAVTIGAH